MSVYKFTRVSDVQILEFFKDVRDANYPETANVAVADSIGFALDADGSVPREFKLLFESTSYLIQHIMYNRSVEPALNITYSRDAAGPFIDQLSVTGRLGGADVTGTVTKMNLINKFINMSPPVQLAGAGTDGLQQSAVILNQVSAAAAEIASFTAKRHLQLDELREQLIEKSEERFRVETARLNQENEAQHIRLKEVAEQLSHREKALDDRANTHVRREIQETMAGLPKTIMMEGLLEQSAASSLTVSSLSLGVGVILAVCAIYTGQQINVSTIQNTLIFLEITRILLGIGAGTAVWFSIRQVANRYRQISQWEQELNRFRLDVERASFLIEGDLEARKINDAGLPDIMLEAFSRGLFAGDRHEPQDDQVGSAILHLLNRPAGLKIGPSGVEASFDKAGLKKSGKEIEQ